MAEKERLREINEKIEELNCELEGTLKKVEQRDEQISRIKL
jgi:hypothetical protein